jgi:hypothetical protein
MICFEHVFGSPECISMDLGRLGLLSTAANDLMRFDRFFPISCISKLPHARGCRTIANPEHQCAVRSGIIDSKPDRDIYLYPER